MRLSTTLICIIASLAGMSSAQAADDQPTKTVDAFMWALSRADLPTLLDQIAADATIFGPMSDSPARIEGRENIAAVFEPLFEQIRQSGEGPVYMNLIPRDTNVQQMGDMAVVTFHLGQVPDQPLMESYSFSRRTFVLRLVHGHWKIVHLHASNVIIPPDAEDSELSQDQRPAPLEEAPVTDFIIAKIRLAHCKKGPNVCELCREYDEGRYCVLDIDPKDRGLMQRRTIEVKRGTTSEWREFDIVKIFDDESDALRYAESEDVFVNPP